MVWILPKVEVAVPRNSWGLGVYEQEVSREWHSGSDSGCWVDDGAPKKKGWFDNGIDGDHLLNWEGVVLETRGND